MYNIIYIYIYIYMHLQFDFPHTDDALSVPLTNLYIFTVYIFLYNINMQGIECKNNC